MESKEIENILNKCDTCKLQECINCKMSYTERQKIKEYVEELETREQKLIKKLEFAINFGKTGTDVVTKIKIECLENVLKILKGEANE